ncbi:hypothetical protein [Fischerella sp. PCC 9605]|uniref:hypothetical protein n=1 Tax=Fischerella sp. PCC 9605 TaxID=1173024 RepID=UPI00047ACA75|nr:hypothetical protein [Fischerella sp. PCC 9605]
MNLSIAYLAQGKLYLKFHQAPVREFESQFGQTVQERMLQTQQRKAWKNRGLMEMMLPPGVVEQMQQQPEAKLNVVISSLCKGEKGKLIYALEAGDVGGIFTLEPSREHEQRLFHNADFQVGYLSFHPEREIIACATIYRNGIANIAMMPLNGSRPHDVTEGDSIDLAPCWIPGKNKALVFQSAGIGRNSQGYVCDRAPFSIEKLDCDRQEITTLVADPKYDFLGPRMKADGTLYYIRRPYRPKQQVNLLRWLREILLIPFRLAYAIFQWLNFFTQIYTGKPLMAAGTRKSLDRKQMRVWGELITPEMIGDNKFSETEAPAWVPRSWQLVRQLTNGVAEVVAEGVLSFDLGEDGTIVYTNGSGIYAIHPDGNLERLFVGNSIEFVAIVNG